MTTEITKDDRRGRGLQALFAPEELTIEVARHRIEEILAGTIAHETATRTRALTAELAAARAEDQRLRDRITELEQALAQREADVSELMDRLGAERAATRRQLAAIVQIATAGQADNAGEPGCPDIASAPDPAPAPLPAEEPGEAPLPEPASSPGPDAEAAGGAKKVARRPRDDTSPATPALPQPEPDTAAPVDAGDTTTETTTVELPAELAHACAPLIDGGMFPDLDTLVVTAVQQFLATAPHPSPPEGDDPGGRAAAPAQPRAARRPASQAPASRAASSPARCGAEETARYS